mmetsp:Transcript_26058/g.34195  ORF Transcript_26058/g.34195 Transcript_26058/m.34195 type:complete len:343 (+) Transcript_26058:149-1177(+)
MGQELSTGLADCCINDSAERPSQAAKRPTSRKIKKRNSRSLDPENAAVLGVQKVFRGYKTRERVTKKVRSEPRPVYVKVNFAENLMEPDSALVSTIDTFALVTCITNPTYKHLPESSQVAIAKTDLLKNISPREVIAWDQELLLAPLTGDIKLLITIISRSTFGRDECLGQVIINLYSDGSFKLEKDLMIPLVGLNIPVRTEDGTEMNLRRDRAPEGTISLSLRTVPRLRSKVGPALLLQQKGLMGASAWVDSWMVLADSLLVFPDHHQSTPSRAITLDKIIEIKDIVYRESIHEEGMRAVRLRLQDQEDWFFRMQDENDISDWLQKLRRAAIQVQYGVEVY